MGGHNQGMADPVDLPGIQPDPPSYLLHKNDLIRSEVWRGGDWVFKRQPKFLCDNEIYCLNKLWQSGYVPWAERHDIETLKIAFINKEPITNRRGWLQHIPLVLAALNAAGIRHGDLSEYAIIPVGNRPVLIDFAESRLTSDTRDDKRPEGDPFWLKTTMERMVDDE